MTLLLSSLMVSWSYDDIYNRLDKSPKKWAQVIGIALLPCPSHCPSAPGGSRLSEFRKIPEDFFKNQQLFQWLFVKSTKISDKNLNIWYFSDFLQKLKIFVNKNIIKMENIKVTPIPCFQNDTDLYNQRICWFLIKCYS